MRKNIGLLINDLNTPFTSEAVKGAELGARAMDANMYIFPGMYLNNTLISDDHLQYEYQYNTLFQFANDTHLDILYIMMGLIGCRAHTATSASSRAHSFARARVSNAPFPRSSANRDIVISCERNARRARRR